MLENIEVESLARRTSSSIRGWANTNVYLLNKKSHLLDSSIAEKRRLHRSGQSRKKIEPLVSFVRGNQPPRLSAVKRSGRPNELQDRRAASERTSRPDERRRRLPSFFESAPFPKPLTTVEMGPS